MTNRSCGSCTVCCAVLGVEGFKPDFTRCKHQCSKGCGVYAERPQDCRDYACLWLHDLLPEKSDRPDKLGVVFSISDSSFFGDYVQVAEVRVGAVRTERVQTIVTILGEHHPVLLIHNKTRTLIAGPESVRRKLVEALSQRS